VSEQDRQVINTRLTALGCPRKYAADGHPIQIEQVAGSRTKKELASENKVSTYILSTPR
jgi:hypothetical protein